MLQKIVLAPFKWKKYLEKFERYNWCVCFENFLQEKA